MPTIEVALLTRRLNVGHADIHLLSANVCFSPKADMVKRVEMSGMCQKQTHALQQRTSLFDHLIGRRKQFVWDGESERFGGLEIDDQLILCRQLHGEIGRLLALEDAVDISCRQAKLFAANVTLRDQAAWF